MVWIFAVVAVALVTIIVELLIVYQKKALDLRMRQEPLRRRIREHLQSMREDTRKIRQSVAQLFDELDFEMEQQKSQAEELGRILSRLEAEHSDGIERQKGRESQDGAGAEEVRA